MNGNQDAITCDVPMADVAAVFQSKPALDIGELRLLIRPESDSIPTDLLGQSFVTSLLAIYGKSRSVLIVDPNAFRSSMNSSLSFVDLDNLNTSQMDLNFLSVFPSVDEISFYRILNLEGSF